MDRICGMNGLFLTSVNVILVFPITAWQFEILHKQCKAEKFISIHLPI